MYAVVGEALRIPFRCFDAYGGEVVDLVAGDYEWPLCLDGVETSPDFAIERPESDQNGMVLVWTPDTAGNYTWPALRHVNSGWRTNLGEGLLRVSSVSLETIAAALAVPAATPSASQFRLGDKLLLFRGDDFSVTFTLYEADEETPRDLTGSTFRFAIGKRTAAIDTATYAATGIAPLSPATDGQVKVTIGDATTRTFAVGEDWWYELVQTDSGGNILHRGLGPLAVLRDIPGP